MTGYKVTTVTEKYAHIYISKYFFVHEKKFVSV